MINFLWYDGDTTDRIGSAKDPSFWLFMGLAFLIVLAVVIVILVIRSMIISKNTYTCAECGENFNKKWYQLLFSMSDNGKYYTKCPKCGKKTMCSSRIDTTNK